MISKSNMQLAIGLAISGVFLYWVLRPVDFGKLGEALAAFQWIYAIPFLAVTFASLYLRAVRWRLLLLPSKDLRSARLFSPLMAGFALNSILPARAGEFARAILVNKADGIPIAPAFASIVVERLFDMIVLLGLLALVTLGTTFDPAISYPYSTRWTLSRDFVQVGSGVVGLIFVVACLWIWRRSGATANRPVNAALRHVLAGAGLLCLTNAVAAPSLLPAELSGGRDFVINGETINGLGRNLGALCMIALAGAAAFLAPQSRSGILWLIRSVPYAPRGIREAIHGIATSFATGLESLKSLRSIAQVVWLTVALWLLVGLSFQIAGWGFPGLNLGFLEGQAVNVITCLAILIPAAPGFWGLMEVGIVFSLAILGVESDPSRALAFALLVHSLQYFPIVAVGLHCLWREKRIMGGQLELNPNAKQIAGDSDLSADRVK